VSGNEPILSIRDLSVFFRGEGAWRPAVAKLSFEVGPRETLAVVGESGSGKSVTALAVMGLLPTANSRIEGVVRLDGRNLSRLSDAGMREVRGDALAMIFQEPMTSLNPVLTIGFQIAEALIYHRGFGRKAAEREALRILERVQVPAARQRLLWRIADLLEEHYEELRVITAVDMGTPVGPNPRLGGEFLHCGLGGEREVERVEP